jgi:hypothetical protein
MSTVWDLDPYNIATMGQNSANTLTIASNGIITEIFIEIIPPEEVPDDAVIDFGVGAPGSLRTTRRGRKRRASDDPEKDEEYEEEDDCEIYRIIAKVTIQDKEYVDIAYARCPEVTVDDVNVNIVEDKKLNEIKVKVEFK